MAATRTVVYCRVSTDKQADRGVSLDAQQAKAKAYAELYDLDIVDVVIDAAASAKTLARPGLERALGLLKAGKADALLVVKLDRLTRSVVDLGRLVERYFAPGKAALLSVGEQIDPGSAAGRLVLNVLASVTSGSGRRSGNTPPRRCSTRRARASTTGGWAPYGRRCRQAPSSALKRAQPGPLKKKLQHKQRDDPTDPGERWSPLLRRTEPPEIEQLAEYPKRDKGQGDPVTAQHPISMLANGALPDCDKGKSGRRRPRASHEEEAGRPDQCTRHAHHGEQAATDASGAHGDQV